MLEAMACGAPVIASDCTSVSEIAGDAAMLVDPSSDEAIGNALVRLLRNEPLRRQLIQGGRARAQKFGWQDTVQNTQGVYAELSERPKERPLFRLKLWADHRRSRISVVPPQYGKHFAAGNDDIHSQMANDE